MGESMNPFGVERNQAQLFLDDFLIAEQRNVTGAWHTLAKHPANPLILASGPERALYLFGSVLKEPDARGEPLFRMWYYAVGTSGSPWVALATSRDGLRWEKPELGLVEIDGNTRNNAVFRPDGWRLIGFSGAMRDPDPSVPESERYKLAAEAESLEEKRKHYVTAVSPDGVRWRFQNSFIPTPPAYPDRSCLVWDPFENRYHLYCRAKHAPPELVRRGGPAYFGRAVSLCTSSDFRTWSESEMVMHADADDADGTEIYGIGAFPYEGQWVGLPQIHRSLPELAHIDVAVAHSRDGRSWQRERTLVLERGGVSEWDRFNQCTAVGPVRVGDELWVYYSGRLYRHGEYKQSGLSDSGPLHVGIGLATLRLDGWRSLQAGFDGGQIVTKPLVLPAGNLSLNAKADWGEVLVEVLAENGAPVEGMRSLPVCADGVRLPVAWPDEASFRRLAGQPVRLRFTLRNALLYSWKVG